jgi:hypothetical protein
MQAALDALALRFEKALAPRSLGHRLRALFGARR